MTDAFTDRLVADGATMLVGTTWNPGGLILAKTVPIPRAAAFVETGLGASYTWHAFTIDQGGIAYTDRIGAVGDQRMRIDPDAVRVLPGGLAWGPMRFETQEGEVVPECTRSRLAAIEAELAAEGLTALVGHELEMLLFDADGAPLSPLGWAPYGLAGTIRFEAFIADVYAQAEAVGLPIEQLHCEYGMQQIELSLAPATPVEAADRLVLMRLVLGRVARDHGLRISFSPRPRTDSAGNGAHQHVSLARDGVPLLGGGDGPHGITAEGASAIAGIVHALPELQGALAGSLLSASRLVPGMWAGAWATWGLENREAAVRLIAGRSPNVEVKVVDPSTSAYVASAAILGAALAGIRDGRELGPEATGDPGGMSESEREDAGIVPLTSDLATALDRLEAGPTARAALGDELVDAIVAQRRFEIEHHGDLDDEAAVERFRFAWSV
ncbi:glutamine synthetase family protein [Agrococcus versicolor]|uniref:Glutamine synthetase family protein n=1 Tax=Agrococcus versicolor TaxID=501482 RepID=A0ABN3AYM9_9MICO